MARYNKGDVIGEYVVQGEPRVGSFCEVYRAKHVETREVRAVKVLKQNQNDGRVLHHQVAVLRELKDCPHYITLVEDKTADEPVSHLVLEYHAETVKSWSGERLPRMMYQVIEDILDGMQSAHDHGFVGIDLNPGNVLLTRDGRAKLCDVNLIRGGGLEDSMTSLPIYTPPFKAPELWENNAEPTVQSDIYAASSFFHYLLTGRIPVFTSGPTRKTNPYVHEKIDKAIFKGGAEDPSRRFSTAAEFAEAIRWACVPVEISRDKGYFSQGLETLHGLVSFFIPRVVYRK